MAFVQKTLAETTRVAVRLNTPEFIVKSRLACIRCALTFRVKIMEHVVSLQVVHASNAIVCLDLVDYVAKPIETNANHSHAKTVDYASMISVRLSAIAKVLDTLVSSATAILTSVL